MSNRHPVPPISTALLDHLDIHYPERCADPNDTEREIWMKAGERRLINRLRHIHARQEASITAAGIAIR